jgi:type I restriction-modification system DNA methylase subunit
MSHVTEVHAYAFILRELTEKKGWKKDQIYTQNEIQNNKLIKEQLDKDTPENIVEITPTQFYVIESKSTRLMLKQAVKEAREDYAQEINKSNLIKAVFITGVAGNEAEGYMASSQYLHNGMWETITENGVEITGLLSKIQVEEILRRNSPTLTEIEISDQEFLKSAEEINGILHEGGINKDYRARVMSAILLALVEGTEINLNAPPTVLIDSINSMVELVLRKNEKPEFARYVKIDLPSSEDNHNKFKKAIVLTIQELLGLNIRSAMTSGKDVLGKFYEVFLKYGNGAKEIGIVLTPRHITKFAAEVVNVNFNDFIYDPTCGTGGFLVAAYDEVKKKTNESRFKVFKRCGLYGIEEQDPVVALAIVNMIFRGDGKTNITEGNCFAKWLNTTNTREGYLCAEYLSEDKKDRIPPITKVLMNPPFPKKKTDYKEYLFIEQALKQMQNGGILFSVLPYSCMIKGGSYLSWRERLLKENTLLSVVTFPPELFAPIGVRTVGVFIKKGVPHKDQKVLWVRTLHDGFRLKKGKRLRHPNEEDDLDKKAKLLIKDFIENPNMKIESIPEFQKASPINYPPEKGVVDDNPLCDKELELCPEAYLDEKPVSPKEMNDRIEQLMREAIAISIKFERELSGSET